MNDRLIKHLEVEYKGKTYVGNKIYDNKEVFSALNKNIKNIPVSFLDKVEEEKGIILIKFKEEGYMERDLKNVSLELYQEFLSEYSRGFN
ncbi:MAG: hypothetical protein GYB35_16110 [Algicola sp.]|nr:hypothetical protein [Algicola sp.]